MITRKHLAISLALLAFVLPLQGQKPSASQTEQGRYQLLAVPLDVTYPASIGPTVEHRNPSQQLFLFDSQTGKVWHYRPESFAGSGPGATLIPEAFIPITIWSPSAGQKVLPEGN